MPELYDPAKRPRSGWAEGLVLWLFPIRSRSGPPETLATGSIDGLPLAVVSCILLGAGAWSVRAGLAAERAYEKLTVGRAPRVPRKTIGAFLTGLGTIGVGLYDGFAGAAAGALGIGAGAAVMLLYGLDPRGEKAPPSLAGVSAEGFVKAIGEANARLQKLDALRKEIRAPAVQQKLTQMIGRAREVVRTIERDPASLPRARKFLNLYLDDAETVTSRFARNAEAGRDPALEQKFLEALDTMDRVFAEQQERLIRSDALDLDVQLQVLTQRLKNEGVL